MPGVVRSLLGDRIRQSAGAGGAHRGGRRPGGHWGGPRGLRHCQWPLHDMDVYLAAATRLRTGQPLYIPGDVAVDSFWYAPWYAVAWIPMSFLPRIVVAVGWSAMLLAATAIDHRTAVAHGPHRPAAGPAVRPAALRGLRRRQHPAADGPVAAMGHQPPVRSHLGRGGCIHEVHAHPPGADAISPAGSGGVLHGPWCSQPALLAPGVVLGITNAGVRSGAAESLFGVSLPLYVLVVGAACVVAVVVHRRYALVAAATRRGPGAAPPFRLRRDAAGRSRCAGRAS